MRGTTGVVAGGGEGPREGLVRERRVPVGHQLGVLPHEREAAPSVPQRQAGLADGQDGTRDQVLAAGGVGGGPALGPVPRGGVGAVEHEVAVGGRGVRPDAAV